MTRFTFILILCAISVSACYWDLPAPAVTMESRAYTSAPELIPQSVLVPVTGLVYLRAEATEHSTNVDNKAYKAGDVVRVYSCDVDAVDGGLWARVRGGWVNARWLEGAC